MDWRGLFGRFRPGPRRKRKTITFRSVSSVVVSPATATTATVPAPAGLAPGDVMLAHVVYYDTAGTDSITPPSGWALLSKVRFRATGGDSVQAIYTKTAGASEPANYVWTDATQAALWNIHILAYSGGMAVEKWDAGKQHAGPASSYTTNTISPSLAGEMIVVFCSLRTSTTPGHVSPTVGYTERYDDNDTQFVISLWASDKVQAVAAPISETPNATAGSTLSGEFTATAIVSILPSF